MRPDGSAPCGVLADQQIAEHLQRMGVHYRAIVNPPLYRDIDSNAEAGADQQDPPKAQRPERRRILLSLAAIALWLNPILKSGHRSQAGEEFNR